jgi:hypothetical protein
MIARHDRRIHHRRAQLSVVAALQVYVALCNTDPRYSVLLIGRCVWGVAIARIRRRLGVSRILLRR